jgi:hypothetical protein
LAGRSAARTAFLLFELMRPDEATDAKCIPRQECVCCLNV